MKTLGKLVVAATLVATMWVGPAFAYDRGSRHSQWERPAHGRLFHRPVARGPHVVYRHYVHRPGHHIRPVYYRHNPHAWSYHRF